MTLHLSDISYGLGRLLCIPVCRLAVTAATIRCAPIFLPFSRHHGAQPLMKIPVKAVVFDAFGTLCELRCKKRPFTKLARLSSDRRQMLEAVMTRPLGLFDAAKEFAPASVDVESLEADLKLELKSMRLFPDALAALGRLRDAGIKVGIASNLAKPYAKPLLDILPVPAEYAWSFEVGYLKPDPSIFSAICAKLGVSPGEAVMVGDTFSTDYLGATAFGMQAIHLDRDGSSLVSVPTIKTLNGIVDQPGLSSNSG